MPRSTAGSAPRRAGWERPSAGPQSPPEGRIPCTAHLAAAGSGNFVELDVSPWHWVGLLGLILGLLAVDLMLHRDNHEPTTKRAVIESSAWIACGLAFAVVVLALWGGQAFGEYLSGYVIEKSLSVDNVFVWAVIFSSFAIPLRYQHRVLFWGIFGALVLRAVFIFAGTALIEQFWWLLLVFGAVLIVSGIKVVAPPRRRRRARPRPRRVKLLGRFLPVRNELAGQKFLSRRPASGWRRRCSPRWSSSR